MGAVIDKAPLPQKDAKAPGVFDNRGFNKECGSPEGGYGASSMYDPGFKKSTCTVQCGWDPQGKPGEDHCFKQFAETYSSTILYCCWWLWVQRRETETKVSGHIFMFVIRNISMCYQSILNIGRVEPYRGDVSFVQ